MDALQLAAQLRAMRQQERADARAAGSQGGAATSDGGMIGGQGMFQTGTYQPLNQNQGQSMSSGFDMGKNLGSAGKSLAGMLRGGAGGPTQAAVDAAGPAMQAGGGSSLGAMALGNTAPATGAGGAAMGALGPIAGFLGGAKALNDSGISSYGDTFRGRAPGKLIDSAFGEDFGDSAVGATAKSVGSLAMGDIPGFVKSGAQGLKSLFKLDWL